MAENITENSLGIGFPLNDEGYINLVQGKRGWDPCDSASLDNTPMSAFAINRINRDIVTIMKDPPPLIFILPDENDISQIHAIISGAANTPYEGGFFYFFVRMPPDYPIVPPRVKLMTTGNGTVRFNPNLYANGKVCLSILGTWSGPAWSAAQSLSSLLLSIQSVMNEFPYYNEPGYTTERKSGDSKNYNHIIRHETLRVAVCDMTEGKIKMPPQLQEMVEQSFLQYREHYDEVVRDYLDVEWKLNPFNGTKVRFNYPLLLDRLIKLKEKLQTRYAGRWFAK